MTAEGLAAAVRRILRRVVRAMVARGLGHPQLTEILKALYIEEAASHFRLGEKRVTDSRISLLTGLQRRDIRAHRDAPRDTAPRPMGPIPRALALWRSDPRYTDAEGAPLALARLGEEAPGFEGLIREIGRDLHPRTILDEMLRLGLVSLDAAGECVHLEADSLLPSRDAELLSANFAANLGDHAEAAAANLMPAPAPGPFFERAVDDNRLSQASVDALEPAHSSIARTRGDGET